MNLLKSICISALLLMGFFGIALAESTPAQNKVTANKVPQYLLFDNEPIPPRCIWYLSLDKPTTRAGTSVALPNCTNSSIEIEKFEPTITRKDGMVGSFFSYGSEKDGDAQRGYIFYKYLGSHLKGYYILVKSAYGTNDFFSGIISVSLKDDRLIFNNRISIDYRHKEGINEAIASDNAFYYTAYVTPWELGTIAYEGNFITKPPRHKTLNLLDRKCIGMAYMKGSKIIGFMPLERCGGEEPTVGCYTRLISSNYNQSIKRNEIPDFFKSFKEACELE